MVQKGTRNKTVTAYDSDADELDEPGPAIEAYVHYLAWCIKKKKNQGLADVADNDYQLWIRAQAATMKTETLGQEIKLIPDY